jgi:hypothetical protein
VREGDATLAAAGSRVVAVTEGVLVQVRGAPVTLVMSGFVRSNAIALPLQPGTQLIANLWPADVSPHQLGLSVANGFIGARSAASADQLQIWQGDLVTGASGYRGHYLLLSGPLLQWTAAGDAMLANLNDTPLLPHGRAWFIKSINAKPAFITPLIWRP